MKHDDIKDLIERALNEQDALGPRKPEMPTEKDNIGRLTDFCERLLGYIAPQGHEFSLLQKDGIQTILRFKVKELN